jgi:exodeoxyribonuclease-3
MFRLMTYNILHGGRGRSVAIAAVINSCAPDLVMVQEATDPATLEKIADAAGMAESRSFRRQSLGYMSRRPVAFSKWTRPRFSQHAFIEVVPAGEELRVFGVHLSAVHAAWTERRRVMELRALLHTVAEHQHGFHVLTGDFNTVAPDEPLDLTRLPLRLRPLVWLSGGRIRWRTIQTVLDAGYVDAFRLKHGSEPGPTLPTVNPHIRLDYVFMPRLFAGRLAACDVVRHQEAVRASDHFPVVADLLTAGDGRLTEGQGDAVQEQGAAAEVRATAGRGEDLGRDLRGVEPRDGGKTAAGAGGSESEGPQGRTEEIDLQK